MRGRRCLRRLPDPGMVEEENDQDHPQDGESRRYGFDREDAEFIYGHAEFEMLLDMQAFMVRRQT